MQAKPGNSPEWLVLRWHRTFEIAERLDRLLANQLRLISRIRDEELEPDLIENWPKDTLVHKFARLVAHDLFYDETGGPYTDVQVIDQTTGEISNHRYLSATVALQVYEIQEPEFEVPAPDGQRIETRPNLYMWQESNLVADECHDYFINELMHCEVYEQLLRRIAAEVFHVVFANRKLLHGLNWIMSLVVSNMEEEERNRHPHLASQFRSTYPSKLRRAQPPTWARNAVFHRDAGRCVYCRTDLTRVYDSLKATNFDHMVPLDAGGLNDVTNLQLLCQDCNAAKSSHQVGPGEAYRRWYPE